MPPLVVVSFVDPWYLSSTALLEVSLIFDSFKLLPVLCDIWTSGVYPPFTLLATNEPDWFVPFVSLAERVIAEKHH